MSKKIVCPFCGSQEVKTTIQKEERELPFGPTFSYEKIIHTCPRCKESGEFDEVSNASYEKALEQAEIKSLEEILDYFSNQKFSMAYIERALQLPQRTLVRWKSKGGTASGIALMRLIRTFPWLLKIAENNYNEYFATRELVNQASLAFEEAMEQANIVPTKVHYSLSNLGTELDISAKFKKVTEPETYSDLVEATPNQLSSQIVNTSA